MKFLYLISYLYLATLFGATKSEYVEFKVVYPDRPDKPCVYVEVAGQRFLHLFDLGAGLEFALTPSRLSSLCNKELFGQCHSVWFNGTSEKAMQYFVPQVTMSDLVFKNVIVEEVSEKVITNDEKYVGFVGSKILQHGNLVLDFPQSKILFIPHSSRQPLVGYDINSWLKVNFKSEGFAIVVTIKTDVGEIPFVFDTGATHTVIDRSLLPDQIAESPEQEVPYDSATFTIGGFDLGPHQLIGMEWKKVCDEQAFLGMDFMKHHVFYIDYLNKVLYIKP